MRTTIFAALPLLLAACGGGSSPPEPPAVSGAFFATSDFTSGTLASLDLKTRAATPKLDTIDPQGVVRAYDGSVYVLDQTHGVVRVYDLAKPQPWMAPMEIATGNAQLPAAQANPHDIYVDAASQRAFVTLYGSFGSTMVTGAQALGYIDLKNPGGGIAGFIPLQVATADKDGNPDADRLFSCGGKLYVTLQDLDRQNMYQPAGPARLAVIDLSASPQTATAEYIQLAGQNPSAVALPGGACGEAIIGHADFQLGAGPSGKGGIERVDLPGKKSLGLVLTDQQLGGNVSALDAADAGHVFADLVSKKGMDYQHEVFVVDLAAKQKGARVLGPLNYVPAVRVAQGNLLVLSAGTPAMGQLKTGVYLGATTGEALPEQPIDLGLPPISVDLY